MHTFIKERSSFAQIIEADGLLDTADTPGLLILEGRADAFVGRRNYYVFMPGAVLFNGVSALLDRNDTELVDRLFSEMLDTPWGVLSLLSHMAAHAIFWGVSRHERARRFLPAVARYWDLFVREGARYSDGSGTPLSLWEGPITLWEVLSCLGVPSVRLQDVSLGSPEGDLQSIVKDLGFDVEWPAADRNGYQESSLVGTGASRGDEDQPEEVDYIPASPAMHVALKNGDAAAIQRLIEAGEPANVSDLDLLTEPILWAVEHGAIDLMRFLLDRGASIETLDAEGYSPLTIAVSKGDANMVRLLIDYGANVQYKVPGYFNTLEIARRYGYTNIVALLNEALQARHNATKSGISSVESQERS